MKVKIVQNYFNFPIVIARKKGYNERRKMRETAKKEI